MDFRSKSIMNAGINRGRRSKRAIDAMKQKIKEYNNNNENNNENIIIDNTQKEKEIKDNITLTFD